MRLHQSQPSSPPTGRPGRCTFQPTIGIPPGAALFNRRSYPKRLRRTHKLMKAYGEPWQYSVFYCTLKDIDRVRLENELREILNLKVDQVLIVDLGSNEDAARRSAAVLGPSPPEQEDGIVVV